LSTRQQELQLGTPVRGTVGANGTNYYQLGWSSAADDLLVSLTPLGGSKPELYLSCRYPFPNATAHSWGLRTREASVLRINVTEAEGEAGGAGCHWPGKLWLAVVGERGRGMATYSLTVSTGVWCLWKRVQVTPARSLKRSRMHANTQTKPDATTTMPVLLPGVPLAGEARLNKLVYYQLRGMAGGYVDYDVIVTVTSGGTSGFWSTPLGSEQAFNLTSTTHKPRTHFDETEQRSTCTSPTPSRAAPCGTRSAPKSPTTRSSRRSAGRTASASTTRTLMEPTVAARRAGRPSASM